MDLVARGLGPPLFAAYMPVDVVSSHRCHQWILILALVTCVILQVRMEGLVSTFERVLAEFGVILSAMVLDLLLVLLSSPRAIFAGGQTYLRSVGLVLKDYALLITLNRKYIEIAVIPFAMLTFIGALASKVRKYETRKVTKSARLPYSSMGMAFVPFLLQLILVVCTQYKGQGEKGNIFIFSSFLLFLGSALSALTMMIDSTPVRDSPDVYQALPAMHKTCIVMLMMTAHSMATEWLWEDMVFAFMPEVTSVLAWFTIYCHHPKHVVTINRSLVIVLSSVGAILLVCQASLYAQDRIILRSWLVRVFCISSSSSALSYLNVWLLDQWPDGSRPNSSGGLVQLLKISSLMSSCVSACIAAAHSLSLISPISPLMHPYAWSLLAMLLGSLAIIEIQRRARLTQELSKMIEDWWRMDEMAEYRPRMGQDWYGAPPAVQPQLVGSSARRLYEKKQTLKYLGEMKEDWYMAPPADGPLLTGLYDKDQPEKYLEQIILAYTASKQPEVVCIFGLGRCNKTDIASKVYESIKGKFDCHLSVKVGQNPDMAQLIRNMIKQVDNEYIRTCDAASDVDQFFFETSDVDQLTRSLRQLFQKKSYLVVLDDLWSNNDWMTIKSCFPHDNDVSRIMITTRFEDAAKAAGDHFYWIPAPAEAEVERLFSRKIPESSSGVSASKPRRKEDAFERPVLQWNELEQMKQLIRVRYNGLSVGLRTCLLYLSIFPEKHEIEIERLVRLWLALGFGRYGCPITEETASSYIKELIARKLIKESSYVYDGTVRRCTVHPLIHEFIVRQATQNNFSSLVHEEQRDVSPNKRNVRWLSLQNSTKATVNHGEYLSGVHSVTAFGEASGIPPLTRLKKMRVLDLEGCEGPLCLDGLWELERLRYLSLRGTDISEVPEWIEELIYLQTLDVSSTEVKKLPPSIVRLENLMHLLAGDAELPPGISKMKALVTLSCASIVESSATVSIKELGEIASLRELELFCAVTQRSEDDSLPSILKNKGSEDEKQVTFLSSGFPFLKKLSIRCSFTSVIFETGALPEVQVLELKFNKGVPEESAAVSGIEHLKSMEHVVVEFSQPGRGNAATWDAVRRAAEIHSNEVRVHRYKSD